MNGKQKDIHFVVWVLILPLVLLLIFMNLEKSRKLEDTARVRELMKK